MSSWFAFFTGVALKGTLILGMAWLAAWLLRKRSAAARHLVWTAAAAAVLALPVLSVSLPNILVPAANPILPAYTFQVNSSTSQNVGASAAAASARFGNTSRPAPWRPDWKNWLMLLWAAGVGAAFLQLMMAFAGIQRARRIATPFPDRELSSALTQAMGIRRPVDVLETKAGSMPMTCGILRSTIFLPSDASAWSEDRRRVVLLHELAHVRRGDVATHLFVRAALSLYWWNPLAWMAWREFLKERERATDDLVLNAGARASEYAGHLLEVARSMQSSQPIGWAAVAMARPSQIEARLVAILDSRVDRNTAGRASALVAAVVAVAMVAPLAAVRAQDNPVDLDATIRAAVAQKNHEMLENAAKAAEQLRKFDTAQTLLQSAAAIRANISGEQSVEYAIGLLKLGDLEQKRNDTKSAEHFYSKAVQVLGDRPEAARALIYLGTAALVDKDLSKATDYFEHAQRVDPTHAGQALMWMAVVRSKQDKPDEAEALFKDALAAQDPASLDAVITMRVYAQFLRKQQRDAGAAELSDRAAAVQKAIQPQLNPALSPGVYKIGGGVSPPSVLSKKEPQYSDAARAAMLAGTSVVQVEIGPDGLARNPRIVRSLGLGLDEKAIDAISQWTFRPGMKDGQPVTVLATIEVNFRLL